MSEENISDEQLVALADGELPAAEATALRGKIAVDPALAERFALFVETRALLEPQDAAAGEADDPAGLEKLAAAIRGSDAAQPDEPAGRRPFAVIDGGGAAPSVRPSERPTPRFRVAIPALAASVALALGGVLGFVAGRETGGDGPTGDVVAWAGSPAAGAAVAAALERAPSGDKRDWSDPASKRRGAVAVVATHRLKDGALCREYEVSVEGLDGAAVGLGCRESGGTWRTEILARGPAPSADYGAASGPNVLDSALEAMGGEGALPSAEEQALLAAGWTKRPQ